MHIQDGVLSPAVCAATAAVSLGAVGYSLRRLKESVGERTIPLTGMMAALVFAGQMVNFPIGAPVSGHLLGGVLATTVVGPWAACVAMTLVLFVQWSLFSDGGLFALGANVLHMAVIGAWGGHAVRMLVQRWVGGGRQGIVVGSVVAAWCSVMAAAALFCVEFRLSWPAGEIDFSKVFAWMVSFHSLIGVGEALITGVAVSFVISQRPELLSWRAEGRQPPDGSQGSQSVRGLTPLGSPDINLVNPTASFTQTLVGGLIFALTIAAFLAPFASKLDDGLETVLNTLNLPEFNLTASVPGLFEDYKKVPVPISGWQAIAVSIAGIGGTLAVFGLAWLLGKALPAARPTLSSEAA